MKNLFYCVALVKNDLDETHTRRFQKMLTYAVGAYKDLEFKLPEVSITPYYFTPSAALMAPLPPDYVKYTKIGIYVCGQLVTLTLNPDMKISDRVDACGWDGTPLAPVQKDACGNIISVEGCGCDECKQDTSLLLKDPNSCTNVNDWWKWGVGGVGYFRNGQYVGENFSKGGGISPMGFFKIDKKNNRILLQNSPITEYYMEYISSGVNGGTIIPDLATDAVRCFIKWQLKDNDGKSTMNDRMEAKVQYYYARSEYFDKQLSMTADEWLDAIFQSFYYPK